MPKRKRIARSGNESAQDIETLRRKIQEGFPWLLHTADNTYRRTGLTTRQNILLAYITGINSGAAVFLAGEPHPSRETVAYVKAQLQADIDEAEKRFKGIFTGRRRTGIFFRDQGPNSPTRSEF
jgi:hypothetical protein